MRYGFILDQTKCIGCHACTVACKSENDVAVGVFRTWVKYIEKGTFPDVRRHFSVMRCNQCDDAPCIEICPTTALFRRGDGIVDFDTDRCIGCKSCMQACPYDALYIDPASQTAAKCNFCSHRVDAGLQPACQIVCPTQAILSGDLDDPESEIARQVALKPVSVRKPEKGTRPKVFYIGADQASLDPDLTDPSDPTMFVDHGARPGVTADKPPVAADARVVYDIDHPAPWGEKVGAYLFTKAIAAGAILVPALVGGREATMKYVAPGTALFFLAITSVLLIADLKRPERFFLILTKPNWTSWLVLGTLILAAFGAVTTVWLMAGPLTAIRVPAAALAVAAACYSAFLFHQCDGRDFWQSPLLFVHLLAGALVAGAAFFGIVDGTHLRLLGGVVAGSALLMFVDFSTHSTTAARRAARSMMLERTFWPVVVVVGHVVPILLAALKMPHLTIAASLAALLGLFEYERLWVKAGQAVPIS